MHDHSLIAYVSIAPDLSKRQSEVFEVFRSGKQYTDRTVAQMLGLEINQVTGRIAELIAKGKIFEAGVIKENGRPRRLCQVVKQTLF